MVGLAVAAGLSSLAAQASHLLETVALQVAAVHHRATTPEERLVQEACLVVEVAPVQLAATL
jgi:hypothetical protein